MHIKEIAAQNQSVLLLVDGSLDAETILVLSEVCKRHWDQNHEIQIDLEGLIRISREGMDYLQEIQGKTLLIHSPKFVKLGEQE